MAEGQPVHWGNIDAETAKRAEALMEAAERNEWKRFPFDEVSIEEDLQAIKDVKQEVEEKMSNRATVWEKARVAIIWGRAHVTKEIEGRIPHKEGSTYLEGFVILSNLRKLPWDEEAGQRGGIYTWGREMTWRLEEKNCYLLSFTAMEQK